MVARITKAEARRLGLGKLGTATEAETGTARRGRRKPNPYHTRCHDCPCEFTTRAAEDDHVNSTGHARYELVIDTSGRT